MPRFYRKIIRIRAEDSPNVQLGLRERAAGRPPSNQVVLPGVLSWADYVKRRQTWDPMRQCIGLDAEFYEGAEAFLYPAEWLNRAERIADLLDMSSGGPLARRVKAIGIDPAEGGDKTSMCAIDEYGVVELISKKTPNTNVIVGEALAFMRKHNVSPLNVCFDRGGGGKQHADRMRDNGYPVKTVGFGESPTLDLRRGISPIKARQDIREEKYAYKNRRAEMYGILRNLLDPAANERGFGIPARYSELRKQLAPIPLQYDGEGRLTLPPKHKKSATSTEVTLTEIIGHSPDEADALVLATFVMCGKVRRVVAGAL